MKIRNYKEKGFTIVEMIVVVAIIVIISAIVLINYPNAKRQLLIQRATSKLSQDIRRAQSMSVSSKVASVCAGGAFPLGGYGIYLNSSTQSINIFADCNSNQTFDAGESVESITLETDARISSLSPSNPLIITFSPPNPIVYISNIGAGIEGSIIVNLASDALKTKTIKINKAGLIKVE